MRDRRIANSGRAFPRRYLAGDIRLLAEVDEAYGPFKSLDDAHTHLKPGLTFAQLDAVAYAESDLATAERLNDARHELFGTVLGDPLAV